MSEPGATTADAGPVVVAVVSWNTRELLGRCLDSLRADADAGLADVWVIDNGSEDGSPALVRDAYPWVTLVETGENLGFGKAVNLAAERTSGTWIVAANADVTLDPGALARLRATGDADPRTAVVGPRLRLLDGSTQPAVQPFPGLGTTLLRASHAARFSARAAQALYTGRHREPAAEAPIPWMAGAFLLIRRSAFDAVGRFDPTQWLYAEDMDLCWRLRQQGWTVRYESRAEALHAHSAASGKRFADDELFVHMATMNYLWLLKRRGALATRASALASVADATVRVALLSALAARDEERFRVRRDVARAELRAHGIGLLPRAVLRNRAERTASRG